MKNLLKSISQQEKNEILEMHNGKKNILKEDEVNKFATAMVIVGTFLPGFMRYLGARLGEFIVNTTLDHDDKTAIFELFDEIKSNPKEFKLTYEKNDDNINIMIESVGKSLNHRNRIELPIGLNITKDGFVSLEYIGDEGKKQIRFNMGRKAYKMIERAVETFGEDLSN